MSTCHLTFFPQFCREPLNDDAWYPGFTDWDLVRKVPEARRDRFVPLEGYYDLGDPGAIAGQFTSFRSSRWRAMALYHYFFDGRFVLDGVERHVLAHPEQSPPFCVIWANETWTKRWIGRPGQIIVRQGHSRDPVVVAAHVDRLAALFRHPAYTLENGRPLFVIYAAYDIPDVADFISTYRDAFARAGVNPLIGFCVPYVKPSFDARKFDFCVEFQPRLFFNVMRARDQGRQMQAGLFLKEWAPRAFDWLTGLRDTVRRRGSEPAFAFDYADYLDLVGRDVFGKLLEDTYQIPAYRGLFYSWNNFPRYRGSAIRVRHRSGDFAAFLALSETLQASRSWSLINSWNEWSEGAALEPGKVNPENFELGQG